MNIVLQSSAQLVTHLKSLRKAKGLTQAQLGQLIGVKQVRLADIERNPGAVSMEQIMQLLHALDARLALVVATPAKAADDAAGKPASPGTAEEW